MVSNAADVTTFFAALLRGRLLPAALLSQMKSFTLTSEPYGLGLQSFFTRCGTAFGHGGDFIVAEHRLGERQRPTRGCRDGEHRCNTGVWPSSDRRSDLRALFWVTEVSQPAGYGIASAGEKRAMTLPVSLILVAVGAILVGRHDRR